ncbi:MAG: endonuclease/exonuclease/phosphatase family protein [Phycisphaerales bacterium]|nr:endonuclease/exonuclease/phosphatase family protein [Phycisphaerales bacterium]
MKSNACVALAGALAVTTATLVPVRGAMAQLRVANYNVAKLLGDTAALGDVLAEAAADDSHGFAVAPAVLAFQEVQAAQVAELAGIVAAAAPSGITYALATYTTSPAEDGSGGAQAMFFRTDLLEEIPSGHQDIPTGAGRNADRWQLHLVGYDAALAQIYVYSTHLKAGSTPQDEATRQSGAQAIRTNIATLPSGAHVVLCGDMNLSGSGEDAYTTLVGAGGGQTIDPLGNGSWSGPANAIKHSQSPRDISVGPLIGGGMDDRFDLQLVSPAMDDGAGLSLIEGTYRSLGNDGLHYNQAINAGNNHYFPGDIRRSNLLANHLFDASDHVPVVADYQVPAVMSAALPGDFGRVILGTPFAVTVLVGNIADVVDPAGVDTLDFTVAGSGGLSGVESGSVGALPELAAVPLPVATAAVGFVEGAAVVTAQSEATQFPFWQLFTEGQIVRAANASFSSAVNQDLLVKSWTVAPNTGVQVLAVPIYNFGFDGDQALLDVDRLSGLAGRFSLGGVLPTGIGGVPGSVPLAFDTDGASPGTTSASVSVIVSDEDIPGATSSTIILIAEVVVEAGNVPGDLDGNGTVDGADLGLLLGAWGSCPGCDADLNGNGQVDGADLGQLLGLWS